MIVVINWLIWIAPKGIQSLGVQQRSQASVFPRMIHHLQRITEFVLIYTHHYYSLKKEPI